MNMCCHFPPTNIKIVQKLKEIPIKENPKHVHRQLFTDPLIYAGMEIYITEDFQQKRIVEKAKLLKEWNSGPQLW